MTRELLLAKPVREALDKYLEIRGQAKGSLFQSRTGGRLAPQNVDDALKKLAAQANANLKESEHIHLSAMCCGTPAFARPPRTRTSDSL